MTTAPSPSEPSTTGPPRSRRLRRRGLATVASIAGVGASVSAFMLTPGGATPAASARPVTSNVTSDVATAPVARVAPVARTAVAPRRAVTPVSVRRTTPLARSTATRPAGRRTSRPADARAAATSGSPRSMSAAANAPAAAMSMPSSDACVGLNAAVDAFMQHFYAAHLETSPGQQVADALSLDQYTLTHTVLVENMVKPLLGGSTSALDVFMAHVYAAHLATSPGQQAADALAVDQYALTHTVMIADMLAPLAGTDVSSC